MVLLVDLFGFLSVILRGLALALAAISLGGVVFRYGVIARGAPSLIAPGGMLERLVRIQHGSVLALVGVTALGRALDLSVLISTVGVPWSSAMLAPFALAGGVTCAAGLVLAGSAHARPDRFWREASSALLLLASIVATTHAMGRLEGRAWLLAVSALHQAGGAAWIGGLPYFLLVLTADLSPATRAAIARRYSRVCVLAVAAIFLSALAKYAAYLGVVVAAYGTAYGLMTVTKALLFTALLGFGAGNYWAVRNMAEAPAATWRTRRFVEVELALGIALFFVAGSLTSLPPAIDLPQDRVAWDTIVARVLTPKTPRLRSPDHSELWYATEQVRLNTLAAAAREQAPRAFVPGAGTLYPRSAPDIAWSEYNHNWSGVFVLAIGILALLARVPALRFARHWPMLFIALGVFIAIRGDPESWPLGSIGFIEAFREPGVVQHRLLVLLVLVFGFFEWRVRVGQLAGTRAAYVFPLSNVLGGILLLTHSHVLENIQQALLTEMSHIPLGLLALVAGCARWLELRAESPIRERAGWIWPLAFVMVGAILLFYRES